jgi:hypothetical protein
MTAYKLFRKRKDGTLGPLFINRKQVIPAGVELPAENHYRKGFKRRMGWHCTFKPHAPHLSMRLSNGEQRVWCKVEDENFDRYERPESQGGAWVLAQKMTLIEEIS